MVVTLFHSAIRGLHVYNIIPVDKEIVVLRYDRSLSNSVEIYYVVCSSESGWKNEETVVDN